jgi:hypothetical protein
MSQEITAGNHESVSPDQRYRVNFGECCASLRQLMRRYTLSYVYITDQTDTNSPVVMFKQSASKFPLYFGYDPHGLHSAVGLITTGSNFPFNFVATLPYHWITPCFIAQRGSMNWSFNVDSQRPVASIRMVRKPDSSFSAPSNAIFTATPTDESVGAAYYLQNDAGPGCGGSGLTNQNTQSGLNVVLPNFTQYRFQNTAPSSVSNPTAADGSDHDWSILEVSLADTPSAEINSTKIWKYQSIGVDWGCYFFLNVPTRYIYGTFPTAA